MSIKISNLNFRYSKKLPLILDDISLEIETIPAISMPLERRLTMERFQEVS